MRKLSKKECEAFYNREFIPKIDELFRKRMRLTNDLVEIIARGIVDLYQRFDELEETLSAHRWNTPSNYTEIK